MNDRVEEWPAAPGRAGPVPPAQQKRVRTLPRPTRPPPGLLEEVGRTLAHRAMPFDASAHAWIGARWGIDIAAHLDPGEIDPASPRVVGACRRELRALARSCPPPPVLPAALSLSRDAPTWTADVYRQELRRAGLSEGQAGAALVRGLASMWRLEVQGCAALPTLSRERTLKDVAQHVKSQGAAPHPELPAGESDWYLESERLRWHGGYLIALNDQRSTFGRAIRRQLQVAGVSTPDVLAQGVRRLGPDFAHVDAATVAAWAAHQSFVRLIEGQVRVVGDTVEALGETDTGVFELFTAREELSRQEILQALTDQGLTTESARAWLVHCVWLRPGSTRGRYRLL